MLAALVMAVAVFFRDAILLRGAFFVQDVMVQNYPFRDFYSEALKQWSLPLWHPGINCGFPLFAEGQAGVLYPFNLLTALLLPTYAGLTFNVTFHILMGAAGIYGYLRVLGCVRPAALVAGLTYGLSGFLIVRAMSQNYIDVSGWTPFLFLFVELALRRARWTFLWLAAGVIGLQLLAGHPQAAVYAAVAAIAYGVVRGASFGMSRGVVAAILVIVPVLGVSLAAVQILPTVELVQLSGRSEGLGFDDFAKMSLPPERLIALLLPNAFGNPSTGSYWGTEVGFFIQLCPYLGVLPLVLALVAVRERRDAVTTFFCILCCVAIALALGKYTGLAGFLYHIPGWSLFRIPTRFLAWLVLGGAVLAGLGMDSVLRDGRRGGRCPGAIIFILLIPVAILALLNRQILFPGSGGTSIFTAQRAEQLLLYRADLFGDLIRCGVMLCAGFILLSPRLCSGWRRPAIAWLVPIFIYADLYSFGASFNSVMPPEVYTNIPESAEFIRSDAQSTWGGETGGRPAPPLFALVRVAGLVNERNSPYDWHSGWALDSSSYRHYPETLRMYTGSQYGIANTLPGWSPLHLRRHWQFATGHLRFFSLANVAYIISYEPLSLSALELVHDNEVRIYRNRDALPRAYVVPHTVVRQEAESRLRYLRSGAFDPRREVVVETPAETEPVAATREESSGKRFSTARIVSYGPEHVEVDLGSHGGGMLVLSDTHYPGWRAWVDGAEARLQKANHVFRAVAVEQGAERVTFSYQPLSFRIGAWISAAAIITVLCLLWLSRDRTFRRDETLSAASADADFSLPVRAWTLQAMLVLLIHSLLRFWPLWSAALERSRVTSVWAGIG